jgi:DNA polymerase-3 subunit alpha
MEAKMIVTTFDTETTDLVKHSGVPLERQPRIVELFAHKFEVVGDDEHPEDTEFKLIDEIEFRVNPGISIPPIASRITGITDEMVAELPRIWHHMQPLRDFFTGVDMSVAHNHSYDFQLVNFEQRRERIHAGAKLDMFPWPEQRTCTVEASMHLKGHRLSLTKLHEFLFGEGFDGAHGARSDVEATTRCFQELWRRGAI